MDQLTIIAMTVKSENIESKLFRDLKIVELLIGSGLSFTLTPDIIGIIENLSSGDEK